MCCGRSRRVEACNSCTKPISRRFLQTDIYFNDTFSVVKKGNSGLMTLRRQLISCDWSWHSQLSWPRFRKIRSKNKSFRKNAATGIQCQWSCMLLLIGSKLWQISLISSRYLAIYYLCRHDRRPTPEIMGFASVTVSSRDARLRLL